MAEEKKKSWFARHKVLTIIGGLILIGIVASAAGGGNKTSTSSTSKDASSTTSTAKPATAWMASEQYDKIQTGMTKTQVEQAVGKSSRNCTASSVQGAGNYETCTYGGDSFRDKGSLIVTYANDAVSSKTKSEY